MWRGVRGQRVEIDVVVVVGTTEMLHTAIIKSKCYVYMLNVGFLRTVNRPWSFNDGIG